MLIATPTTVCRPVVSSLGPSTIIFCLVWIVLLVLLGDLVVTIFDATILDGTGVARSNVSVGLFHE